MRYSSGGYQNMPVIKFIFTDWNEFKKNFEKSDWLFQGLETTLPKDKLNLELIYSIIKNTNIFHDSKVSPDDKFSIQLFIIPVTFRRSVRDIDRVL